MPLAWILIAALLGAPVARGADTITVPITVPITVSGTTWTLQPEQGWTADEIDALADLARRLPQSYRDPGARVRFELSDAAPFADGRGHALGRLSTVGSRITLYTRGLEAELSQIELSARLGGDPEAIRGATRILLERVVVHELTHLVDRHTHLSRDRGWRDLSGWRPWTPVVNAYTPVASGDFASPWGAISPEEDLATFAEIYFVPPALGPFDADDAPRCRFSSKYLYLNDHLGPHPDPTPQVICSSPADGQISADQVGEIDVIFAAPTLARAASMSGHLLLAVEIHDGDRSRWDTFALVADAEETGPLNTIVMGVTGLFPSRVDREPYETTRLRYVEGENRDILRYRFVLTEDEKRLLLARLDDMSQHWRRPYLFLQQNCSALIIELANAVEPAPLHQPFVVAPDMVLAELVRRGRVQPVIPDPSRDLSPATRARLLADASISAMEQTCGAPRRVDVQDAEARDRLYGELLTAARAGDADCLERLARALTLSAPLDQAITLGQAQTIPGRDAALEAIRLAVPAEARTSMATERDLLSAEAWRDAQPVGSASADTPYAPLTVGALVTDLNTPSPMPMIFVRRAVIELVHGQPRLFPPARGLDLRALDTTVAVSPALKPALLVRLDLLRFGDLPEPLLPGPAPLIRLGLLSAELSTHRQDLNARWVYGAVGATLLRGAQGRQVLDVSIGLDARSTIGWAEGLTGRSWIGAPLSLHGVAYTDGRLSIGLEAEAIGLPALGLDGAPAAALLASGGAWIYLGRLGDRSVKLTASGRDVVPWIGNLALPAPELALGLRLERR